jgi:hypothetical protein
MTRTRLRRRMLEALQRWGLAPTPQQGSLDAVRQRAHPYRRPPDPRSDAEWRHDVLCLRQAPQGAERPVRIHRYGRRVLYERPRPHPWPVFDRGRPQPPQKLPVGLSRPEVRSLLAVGAHPMARRCLPLREACGLHLRAGPRLQVSDIDAPRMLVRVRQGPGGNDRVVPRAPRGLEWWRADWQRQRPRPWLCPARDPRRLLRPLVGTPCPFQPRSVFAACCRPCGPKASTRSGTTGYGAPSLGPSCATSSASWRRTPPPRLRPPRPRRAMPPRPGGHPSARGTRVRPAARACWR